MEEASRCVDMIEADALAIHMNPLQEAVQVHGETRYRGVLGKIGEIAAALSVPVVMKETGCGIAREDAEKLEEAGLVFSGKAPHQPIMQILELPSHPYFFGTQAHPCLTSRPLKPHPMFVGLVAAAMQKRCPEAKLPDGVKAVREVCKL